MIETLGDLPAGVLGFKGSGRISRAEYQEMMEPIYEALERGGPVNLRGALGGHEGRRLGRLEAPVGVAANGCGHRQGLDSPRERGGRLARSGRAPYLQWARGSAGDRLAG